MLDVLADELVEVLLSEDQEVDYALDLQGLNKPFHECVGIRRPDGQPLRLNAVRRQRLVESSVQPVVIPRNHRQRNASLLSVTRSARRGGRRQAPCKRQAARRRS